MVSAKEGKTFLFRHNVFLLIRGVLKRVRPFLLSNDTHTNITGQETSEKNILRLQS